MTINVTSPRRVLPSLQGRPAQDRDPDGHDAHDDSQRPVERHGQVPDVAAIEHHDQPEPEHDRRTRRRTHGGGAVRGRESTADSRQAAAPTSRPASAATRVTWLRPGTSVPATRRRQRDLQPPNQPRTAVVSSSPAAPTGSGARWRTDSREARGRALAAEHPGWLLRQGKCERSRPNLRRRKPRLSRTTRESLLPPAAKRARAENLAVGLPMTMTARAITTRDGQPPARNARAAHSPAIAV